MRPTCKDKKETLVMGGRGKRSPVRKTRQLGTREWWRCREGDVRSSMRSHRGSQPMKWTCPKHNNPCSGMFLFLIRRSHSISFTLSFVDVRFIAYNKNPDNNNKSTVYPKIQDRVWEGERMGELEKYWLRGFSERS